MLISSKEKITTALYPRQIRDQIRRELIEAIERLKNIEAREKIGNQLSMSGLPCACDKPKEIITNDKV